MTMTASSSSSSSSSSSNNDDTAPLVVCTRNKLPESGKDVVIVSLHRPHRFNSFTTLLCQELAQVFRSLRDEPHLAAIIVTGEGPHFCAGADLTDPPNPLYQSSELLDDLVGNPVHQMQNIQVPLIAALQGHVITGGFELALACDILIGDSTTTFRDTHCKFGLAPCWGLSQRLQQRIGPGRASIVSWAAQPVTAKQALAWGLLDEIADHSLQRALQLADHIGNNDTTMVHRYKHAMVQGNLLPHGQGLQQERALALAHYVQVMQDGTMHKAKSFIQDKHRPRQRATHQSKL